MPNVGTAQAILLNQGLVYKNAAPSLKITPPGYLGMALENMIPNMISSSVDPKTGYIRDVKIRAKKRVPTGLSVDADDCSTQAQTGYVERSIPSLATKKRSIFFDDTYMEALTENALQIAKGAGDLSLPMEFFDTIRSNMNGLLGDINISCLAAQDAVWGVNVVPGDANKRTCNFPLSGASNPLAQGVTMLMTDMAQNEVMWNNVKVVGSGLSYAYWMQHMQNAKSTDASGLNTAQLGNPKYYFDPYAASAWGANEFALIEDNAVQFLNVCKFRGYKGGQKGDSEFTTMLFPITDSLGNVIRTLEFDVQIQHKTCPSELVIDEDDAYPDAVSVERGTIVHIIARFAPVFLGTTEYETTDRLNGNRGSYWYGATNA